MLNMQIQVQPIPVAASSKDINIAISHYYPFIIVKAQTQLCLATNSVQRTIEQLLEIMVPQITDIFTAITTRRNSYV
jgi:hypothetical protein